MKTNYTPTKNLSKEAWLKLRKIGGSDVSAILGMNNFKTVLDVYNDKIDPIRYCQIEITPRMKAGIKLEQTVADWYSEETGQKLQKDNKVRIHKDYNFLTATMDRVILSQNGKSTGVFEAKTTNSFYAKTWESSIPMPYYLQLQHYLNVTGWDWGVVAVLIDGYDFKFYEFDRDEELIRDMMPMLEKFWNENVEKQIPPDPTTAKEIEKVYPSETDKVIECEKEIYEKATKLANIKRGIKALNDKKAELEKEIKMEMKDGEILDYYGQTVATWKQGKTKMIFDTKTFRNENAELYKKFLIEKLGSRLFLNKLK